MNMATPISRPSPFAPSGDSLICDDAYLVIVERPWLVQVLGQGPYALWACLLLARGQDNLVQYSIETIQERFRMGQWGKSFQGDAPTSSRTIKRWFRALKDLGLVLPSGQKTRNGHRIRVVNGDLCATLPGHVKVPAETRAILECWGPSLSAGRRECVGVVIPNIKEVRRALVQDETVKAPPYPKPKKGLKTMSNSEDELTKNRCVQKPVAPPVALRVILEDAECNEVSGSLSPNSTQIKPPVGIDVLSLKAKALRQDGDRPTFSEFDNDRAEGPVAKGPERHAAKPERLWLPDALPADPDLIIESYVGPRREGIDFDTPDGERVRILLNAYTAALDYHYGFSRHLPVSSVSPKLRKLLLAGAKTFLRRMRDPVTFAVAAMSWLKEKGSKKAPKIGQLFNPGFLKKMHSVVDDHCETEIGRAWCRRRWEPELMGWAREYWTNARTTLKYAMTVPGMTQVELDELGAQFFGRVYEKALDDVRHQFRRKTQEDHQALAFGRWCW